MLGCRRSSDLTRLVGGVDSLGIAGERYSLSLTSSPPLATLRGRDGQIWAELLLGCSLDTREGSDTTLRIGIPRIERRPEGVRVVLHLRSTRWSDKRLTLDCLEDRIEVRAAVEGAGWLTSCRLLSGWHSPGASWSGGFLRSGAGFGSVFNPEPSARERRVVPACASTVIDVMGGALPGLRHWFFTPAPFCFSVSRQAPPADPASIPAGPWMAIGLLAGAGEHQFTAFGYEALDDGFGLRLDYEGQTRIEGSWTSPALVLLPDVEDPYAGIVEHRRLLEAGGFLPAVVSTPGPAWWTRPIFCGWGAQSYLALRSGRPAADFSTQASYDQFLESLAARSLRPGTIIIDDRWQRAYGTGEVDEQRWPDLRGWISRRHAEGQRVLLWWKAWDPEGLPAALCVRDGAGNPVAADPTNPAYEAHLRGRVQALLSREGLDADGFKVDFTGGTPSGPDLTRHGKAWGVELLHRLLAIVYDQAKRAKDDALIVTHTPNPYFGAVTDMIRLNDVNPEQPLLPQMRHRAAVARAACPELLIDTDNWQMPDLESFRAYLRVQRELGVPSLYYTTHVDGSSEALAAADYAALLQSWTDAEMTA